MQNRWVKILLWIIFFQIIGAYLGVITQNNIHPWYDNLTKSSLTPPAILFAIVWPILYVLLALAAYLLWQNRLNQKVKPALYCFITQMLMNWAWSPIFFQFQWLAFSLILILTLTLLTLATIFFAKDTIRTISLLLMPYSLWLVFASYLNGYIWFFN